MAKTLMKNLPEFYLVVLSSLAGYKPPFTFSPLGLVLVAIVIFQLCSRQRVLGLIISGLFLALNVYFVFALISELNEFARFSGEALQLLAGGTLLCIVNFFFGGWMFYKNAGSDLALPGTTNTAQH